MTLTGKEAPEPSTEQAAISHLLAALKWEHSREKSPDPIQCAPRTVVYPTQIAGIMEVVKPGRQHALSPDIWLVCAENPRFESCMGKESHIRISQLRKRAQG
jgi:hypothetical protein